MVHLGGNGLDLYLRAPFIKVFITDRFMNKDWEREQIERLLLKQVQKIKHLETKVTEDNPTK